MTDIRLALRFLAKRPGWTVAAVLTVGIGIAGATLAFGLVDRVLWRSLGFDDGRELVTLYARSGAEYSAISWPEYSALRGALGDAGNGPAELAAFVRHHLTVGGADFAELHEGELVSGNYFSVLGVPPLLGTHDLGIRQPRTGRTAGRGPLAHAVADPVRVGPRRPGPRRTARRPFVRGDWRHPARVPRARLAVVRERILDPRDDGRRCLRRFADTGGRRRSDVPDGRSSTRDDQRREALQARVAPLDEALARERTANPFYPDTDQPWRVAVLPGNYLRLWPEYRQPVLQTLLVLGLMAAAGLLIACFNLATLLLARGTERRRELAIRLALGASSLDLARRVGAEVADAGGGLADSWRWGSSYVLAPLMPLLPLGVPYELDLPPDWRVLGFGAAAALVAEDAVLCVPPGARRTDGTLRTMTPPNERPRPAAKARGR